MTTTFLQDFQDHTAGIEHISTGIYSKCSDCQSAWDMDEAALEAACANDEVIDEGGFSWSQCDTCGSHLGGNRYAAHGFIGERVIHLDVCEDCLIYIANGDQPTHRK